MDWNVLAAGDAQNIRKVPEVSGLVWWGAIATAMELAMQQGMIDKDICKQIGLWTGMIAADYHERHAGDADVLAELDFEIGEEDA